MKKILITIIGIICLFSITDVNALSGTASLTCDKNLVNAGDVVNCTLSGSSGEDIVTAISARVVLGENLALQSITKGSKFEGSANDGIIELYQDKAISPSGTFDIATFSVKVNAAVTDSKIMVNAISFTDGNFKGNDVTAKSHSLRSPSTNNNLASLSLSGITIKFDKNTTSYDVKSDATSTTITATAEDNKAKVAGAGNKTINYGNNKFDVVVTSESGATKVYTINVYREDKRSKVNTLKTLKIGGKDYDVNVLNHTINVDNKTTKMVISSTLTDTKTSKYVGDFGNKTVNLGEGNNVHQIKVQAENGDIRTYTITIIRAYKDPTLTNASIKTLTITGHDEFKFTPGVFNYELAIGETENRLGLDIVLEMAGATYKVENNENLKIGDIVIIKVTSSDKSNTVTYQIKMVKKEDMQPEPTATPEPVEPEEPVTPEEPEEPVEEESSLLIPIIVFVVGLGAFLIAIVYKFNQGKKVVE